MIIDEKIHSLYEKLEKTKEFKLSLKRTTREQYYVLTLLIKYYEEEINRYEKKYQLSA